MRIETREEHYPIVRDYFDPKFLFPKKTLTFCTNSRLAHVVQERYDIPEGGLWYSVNGHAWSASGAQGRAARPEHGLVNFAMLKTVTLSELLDNGVPGLLHPSTIMYYPEIKLYANRPVFENGGFRVREGLYMIGDGAGTSRGITAAWASGIRAADAILA